VTGIEKAIELAGGQEELGAMLSPPVSQQAISKWKARGYAPSDRAVEIARRLGIELRELLSPTLAKVLG
jgi:hypothetical protein